MSNKDKKPYFAKRAYDGKWAVYRYMQWPDDYLDTMDDEDYSHFITARDMFRTHGWITVAVFPNRWLAMDWLKQYWQRAQA